MKTKIYIVLLLGLFSIKSNAQEQFLKLDSIQVIYGTISNFSQIIKGTSQVDHFGIDSLRLSTNYNSIIKLNNVQLEIISNGQGQTSFNSGYYPIHDFNVKVNQSTIMSWDELQRLGGGYNGGYAYGVKEFNITANVEILFTFTSVNSAYSAQRVYSFNYRIELHHYSYE